MDSLIESFDINQIEFEDNRSDKWTVLWTDRNGGAVTESGEGIEQLRKCLDFATGNLGGFNFQIIAGGGLRDN